MNHLFKKFLAALLAVVLMCNMLPLSIFAEGIAETIPDAPTGDSKDIGDAAPIFRFDGYKTLDDFGIWESSGFSLRSTKASSSYLNPQTIRPTSQLYGYHWIYSENASHYPFTASFTLDADYMPQNSVYIAIANYDCDEFGNSNSREYDQVYINGHCVGVLTGNDSTSNTTLLKVDRSYLQPGLNEIVIRVGIEVRENGAYRWNDTPGAIYADDPYDQWVLRVDDIQLLCDGGSTEGRPDVFRVNLTRAELLGNQLNCYVTTYVEDSQDRTFTLEYALYDWSCEESSTYGQIIDDDFATIRKDNYQYEGSLTMPADSYSGTYAAVVYLKVRENGIDTILAYDEEQFEYETGIVPSFDIQNLTATPATLEWTSGAVDILLSADIDVEAGLTDLVFYLSEDVQVPATVDENGHVTGVLPLTENGFYTIALCYNKDGKSYRRAVSVEINNIVQAPDDSQQQIFKAGWFTNNTHLVGSTCGYTGSHTFWTTTSAQTDAVDVLVNGKVLGTLGADSIVEQDEATRLYRVKLKLVEGLKTITFRTGDGTDQETIYFGAINPISEQTMYAIGKTVALRTWPSLDAAAATYISLDTPVEVRGEIDIRQGEGFYYALYNGKNYFIDKRDLADTTLEKQFREYVKTVADMYYQKDTANGTSYQYDYNKYYYLASDVKYSWDDAWGRRNDAYSTYDKDSQYNVQLIQQMLIDGIQQKADSVEHIDLRYFVEGQALNPLTGKWEYNEKALKAQEQYNADLEAALDKALDEWGMSLINTTADMILTKLQVGEKSCLYAVVDACTAVATDYAKAKTEALHANITADIQNAYRGMVIQSILDMYNNIDEQMNADNRALLQELNRKSSLTEDEKLLRDQLQNLLTALDTQKAAAKKEIERVSTESATALAESLGLALKEKRTEQEIDAFIARNVFCSVLTNTLKTLVDTYLDLYLDTLSSNEVRDFIVKQAETAFITGINQLIEECLADGSFSIEEACTAIKNKLLKQDYLKEVLALAYEKLVSDENKFSFSPELEKQLEEAAKNLSSAKQQEDYAQQKLEKGIKANYKVNKRQTVLSEKMEETAKAAKNVEDCEKRLNTAKLSSVHIVKDILEVAKNTFNVAKEAVGIGDMADNEVFYAYCANYMVHTMEAAESRRSTLFSGSYRNMANHSYVDKADLDELKSFVNRVYSVYQYDMLGHSTYTTLATGWHYAASGEKLYDWVNEALTDQEAYVEKNGAWVMFNPFVRSVFGLYNVVAITGGMSQSEYLKAVNKKHKEVTKTGSWNGYQFGAITKDGFPPVDFAEAQYGIIAAYAEAAEMPAKFNALN